MALIWVLGPAAHALACCLNDAAVEEIHQSKGLSPSIPDCHHDAGSVDAVSAQSPTQADAEPGCCDDVAAVCCLGALAVTLVDGRVALTDGVAKAVALQASPAGLTGRIFYEPLGFDPPDYLHSGLGQRQDVLRL
ncbi:MAG: hypothetical protein ACE5D3_05855 [Candidatus Binatia bacterium]